MKTFDKKYRRSLFFIAGFLIFSATIIIAGMYYKYATRSYRIHIDQELSAIADLKVKQIIDWRQERMGDASVFYKNDLFSSLVKRYFEKPDDSVTLSYIQTWLGKVKEHYDYERAFLMDANGIERLSIPSSSLPVASVVTMRHSEIMKSKQIVFEDFYRDERDNKIHLAILVPIIDDKDSNQVLGILGLLIDPQYYLYPFISTWPTSSKTSETLLLRREGNEVVFLNDLRFKNDAALNLRVPMNGTIAIPAIKAVLGEEGIVEGLDYRGVSVISAIRTIHGSPWFMVARMDQAEAFAPLKERLLIIGILVCLLLIVVGAGIGLIWKNQNIRFYRERFEASKKLQESEERYKALIQTSLDGFWVVDSKGCLVEVNDAYCLITGYSREKLLSMKITDLEALETPERTSEHIQRIMEQGWDRFESKHRCSDGTILDVLISTLYLPSQKIFLVFINNITDRKSATESLKKSEEKFRLLFDIIPDAIVILDMEGNILQANDVTSKRLGYSVEELLSMTVKDIDSPEYANKVDEGILQIMEQRRIVLETEHKSKEGVMIPTEISSRIIEYEGKPAIISVARDITERKLTAEKCLSQSTALIAAANAIVITDRDGKIEWVNPAFTELTGYTIEEVTGENPRSLKSGKHDKTFYKNLWDTILAGEVWRGDMINKRKDGSEYSEEMTITPIKDQGGAVMRFVAIKQDVSDRKQIEETQMFLLQSSTKENFFESLARYLATTLNVDYVCIDKLEGDLLTAQTVAVYYDGKIEDNIEYTLKETPCGDVVGKTICYFPENVSQLFPNDQALQQMCAESYMGATLFSNTGQPIGLIAVIGRKPMKNRYLSESILRLMAFKTAGEMERRFAEEEIQKLQQQIDYIFGVTKTGMNIIDYDFNLQYVSPAFIKFYGDYTGRKCYEYLKGFQEACAECLVKQAIETKSSAIYETTFPRENDRPAQVTTIPFENKEGQWLAAEVSVDITERKKFEEELLLARSEADRANEAKSEFLSRMSHELRTPLNAILGFAQLMAMGELTPKHKENVNYILSSGKYLLTLINEVLDLSRIEAGMLAMSLESVQLRGIIQESMDIIRPLAEGFHIKLELTDSVTDDLYAEADKQRLKQILMNLLSNAIKYNREDGSVKIECRVVNNGSNIRILIYDTGIGIAPNNIEKIFEPFHRIHTGNNQIEGSGLGLAIVKKLIEAMHGTIVVESQEGQGSTFSIELPQSGSLRT